MKDNSVGILAILGLFFFLLGSMIWIANPADFVDFPINFSISTWYGMLFVLIAGLFFYSALDVNYRLGKNRKVK